MDFSNIWGGGIIPGLSLDGGSGADAPLTQDSLTGALAAIGDHLTEETAAGGSESDQPGNQGDDDNNSARANKRVCARWRGKRFFLTYPRCNLAKEDLLSELQKSNNFSIQDWCIAEEKHQDGTPHLHAYLHLATALDTRNQRIFDVLNFHPNIQAVRSIAAVVKYIRKDKNYTQNRDNLIPKENNDDIWGEARNMARAGPGLDGVEEAIDLLWARVPKIMAKDAERIRKNLEGIAPKNTVEPKYSEDKFNIPFHWDQTKTLILSGPSGTGKTSWALTQGNTLLCTTKEDLKLIEKTTDCIILDDIDLSKFSTETVIHLTDTEVPCSIYCRYGNARIPAGVRRIICTNKDWGFLMPQDPHGAIKRRCQFETITNTLIKTDE